MMEANPVKEFWKRVMNYGAILGLIVVLVKIFLYLLDIQPTGVKSNLFLGVLYIALYVGILMSIGKHYRDKFSEGYLSYAQSLRLLVFVIFFGSIIVSFWEFILIKYIDPELPLRIMEETRTNLEEFMLRNGTDEARIDQTLRMLDGEVEPPNLGSFVTSIFWRTFLGFILSLILAIFIRREKPMFEENN